MKTDKLKEFIKENELEKKYNLSYEKLIEYVVSNLELLSLLVSNDSSKVEKERDNEFIERIYQLYPSKCPKRGSSLGKCSKDKNRIRTLLKTYSMDVIERVVKHEIETKYGIQYMQNFSTFLNNFPDVDCIITEQPNLFEKQEDVKTPTKIIVNGQEYR
jgi:hypothetical protein